MRGLPKEQTLFQLLTMLSDQKGHCNRELAEELRLPKERVSTLSGILEKNGIVYHESRLTTNPNIKRKNPRQEEKPYYIGPEDPHSPQERLNIFRNKFYNKISIEFNFKHKQNFVY